MTIANVSNITQKDVFNFASNYAFPIVKAGFYLNAALIVTPKALQISTAAALTAAAALSSLSMDNGLTIRLINSRNYMYARFTDNLSNDVASALMNISAGIACEHFGDYIGIHAKNATADTSYSERLSSAFVVDLSGLSNFRMGDRDILERTQDFFNNLRTQPMKTIRDIRLTEKSTGYFFDNFFGLCGPQCRDGWSDFLASTSISFDDQDDDSSSSKWADQL